MIKFSRYNIIAQISSKEYIIFNTLSGVILVIKKDMYEFILGFSCKYKEYDMLDNINKFLYDNKVIADDEDEFYLLMQRRNAIENDSNVLQLLLHSTLNCNLSCPYCFQKGLKKSNMSIDVAEKIVQFISEYENKYHCKYINITWSGGEPLLNLEVLKYLKSRLDLCLASKCEISVGLITNGTLLNDENLSLLNSIGVRHIQVTLDGINEHHNKRRGDGTYEIILRNIEFLLINYPKIKVIIRTNIDRGNIDEYLYFRTVIKQRFNNLNYILSTEFVKGKPESYDNIFKSSEKSDMVIKLLKEGAYDFDSIFNYEYHPCLKKSRNSFAIDPLGQIYDCEMMVGKYNMSINSVFTNFNNNLNMAYRIPDTCRSCRLLPICNCGCEYDSLCNNDICHVMKGKEQEFLLLYYNQCILGIK